MNVKSSMFFPCDLEACSFLWCSGRGTTGIENESVYRVGFLLGKVRAQTPSRFKQILKYYSTTISGCSSLSFFFQEA